jgi:DNA-binding response OmpR family regulator
VAHTEVPGQLVGAETGAILEVSEVWTRVHARHERALLELDALIARAFEVELSETEVRLATAVCGALGDAFYDLGIAAARDLAQQLRTSFESEAVGPRTASAFSGVVDDLRGLLGFTGSDAPPVDPDAAPLLAIGSPTAFVERVLWRGCMQGMRVAYMEQWVPRVVTPACIVLVGEMTDSEAARLDVRAITEDVPNVPVIVVATAAPLDVQLRVAPFTSSILVRAAPADVVAEARAVIARRAVKPKLAVFALDPEALARRLSSQGVDAAPFSNVDALMTELATGGSQVLLVGADLDRSTRTDTPSLVRSHPSTRDVGVVSLLEHTEPAAAAELMRAGADAVLPSTLSSDLLAQACRGRLARAIEARMPPEVMQFAGALSQRHATLLVERMLLSAHRGRTTVSVGLFTFDHGTIDDDRFATLGEPLAREFRPGDIVGRWPDRRFIVALKGVGRRTAVRRFEDVLRNLTLTAECRVAVAEFPGDGRTVAELLATAETSMVRARFDDGPRVVSSDWSIAPEHAHDVLIVDGDVTLRALMMTMFERQGLTVAQLNDGVAALEFLTASRDRPFPRVLLMELDLMGLDGLQLLRRLHETGVMSRLKVLVLTARTRESELLEALELGVVDIVTKPFSPALLMHRLRKVIDA